MMVTSNFLKDYHKRPLLERLEDIVSADVFVVTTDEDGDRNYRSWSEIEVIDEARAEIEKLREALRYYAKNHYPDIDAGPWGLNSADFGDVARAALGEEK